MADIIPYIHRDISWLSFNYRVLQEAKDPSVPLFERIKFLSIYSSNLDEFFRVRVANHRNLVRAGKKAKKELDFEPAVILRQILNIVNKQQEEFSEIFGKQIIPELKKQGIHLIKRKRLTREQMDFVEDYFNDHLLPFVQPVLLVKDRIKPFLNNGALYLALVLESRDIGDGSPEYAIVKIPSDHMERFLVLPARSDKRIDVIMLDDVVRHSVRWIFPGYHISDTFSIKLTRDAELYIDDEFSGDLVAKIKRSLTKRNVGPASRMVYDRTVPRHLLKYLTEAFDLTEFDLLPEGRYHNNFDFFKFPKFGLRHLQDSPLTPMAIPELEESPSIFERIDERDHLIHVPYHSYESVVKFFEDAAKDADVTHIKIVQYRVAKESRIMNALMAAVRAGKQVSAFIEVKARFDEEANLVWGERLEKAGVIVHYSMPGLKVHAKMALVRRVQEGRARLYAYYSTGNFHEQTTKVYSDIGIFTADERLTIEGARLFAYLESRKVPEREFEHLCVGQFNLRPKLNALIDFEIEQAAKGKKAEIILKMNSLQEHQMIQRLYEASQKGVQIHLIVRGICSLVSGVKGVSENIHAISIVDRFLEHARIFVFHHGGEERMYLSSADLMSRNLHRRIETMVPIYDTDIRSQIDDLLQIQLNDNVKARLLDHKKINHYHTDGTGMAIRAQIETYYYIKRVIEARAEIESEESV